MARTKGSGWGGGVMLYQICPLCGKKKALYDPMGYAGAKNFKCIWCKERFDSNRLIRESYKSRYDRKINNQ